ncbi:HAD family hydrolase [Stutzerimonas stutzeri]|uniref:HAD family hydrolase n=1 Tax=Stutzerimonas stutzeri TaxID=316 RepID=UPI003D003208
MLVTKSAIRPGSNFNRQGGSIFHQRQQPEPTIYSWICDQLGASPTASWMIGDSQRCDRDGPTAVGIRGFFVDRNSTNGDCPELVTFARKVLATAR